MACSEEPDEVLEDVCPQNIALRWHAEASSAVYATPLITDLFSDGRKDVVVPSFLHNLEVGAGAVLTSCSHQCAAAQPPLPCIAAALAPGHVPCAFQWLHPACSPRCRVVCGTPQGSAPPVSFYRQVFEGRDGAKVPDFEASHASTAHTSPLMYDIDFDGVPDIVLATYNGEILFFKDTVRLLSPERRRTLRTPLCHAPRPSSARGACLLRRGCACAVPPCGIDRAAVRARRQRACRAWARSDRENRSDPLPRTRCRARRPRSG